MLTAWCGQRHLLKLPVSHIYRACTTLESKSQLDHEHRLPAQAQRTCCLLASTPLGIHFVLVGVLNILGGLKLPLAKFRSIAELDTLEGSISAVRGTAEVILGVMLVVTGIGLLRRLRFAWNLTVLFLVIAVALRFAQGKAGFRLA